MNWLSIQRNFAKEIARDDLDLVAHAGKERLKGSGPGGQRRNKVATGIRLTHPLLEAAIDSTTHRESKRNEKEAVRRLRLALVRAALSRPLPTDERRPTIAEVEGILPSCWPAFRTKIATDHTDLPRILFHAALLVQIHDGDLKPVAAHFGSTSSALLRLLQQDPQVRARFDEWRSASGLPRLR